MARGPNPRRVKIHRTYTVEELAVCVDVHANTVRAWIGRGLAVLDDKRPLLIEGSAARVFLERRRTDRKRPCPPGHLYCLPCGTPKRPDDDLVEYIPLRPGTGNLRAFCPTCERLIHRRVRRDRIVEAMGDIAVSFPERESTLGDTSSLSQNSDLENTRTKP